VLFSTLYFPDEIDAVENKLRLNLSDYAFSILNYDMVAFGIGDANNNRISSSFINDIFLHFKDAATSSIALAINVRREELSGILAEFLECNQVVEKMLAVYEKELVEAATSRIKERDKPFSIRVNNRNLEYLRSEEGQAESVYYNNRVGLYMKAVIEEYCQLPYPAREQFFYRENWNEIGRAIDEKKVVKLRMQSTIASSGRTRDNISYMLPMCIEEDSEHMYNYLAGMIGPTQVGPWKIGVVRLSNIINAECQKKPGFLSADDKKSIRAEIKRRGIRYLSDNESPIKVVVQFTPSGEKLYRQMLHLRPICTKKTGLIYEFECPQFQADTYFFKFGHNVKVLEPRFLADKFKRKYQSAARQYD
jgi:hypothetical protein